MEEQQNKSTILVVDDSRVMLIAATRALSTEFELLKASDGDIAWELIQQHPEISMIFSDLSMPNMDGHELLSRIRGSDNAQIAKLPVVILTGQEDDDGTKEQVIQAGATDFITKPFKSLDIVSRAQSLTRLNNQVNSLEKKVFRDKLTRLYAESSFNESGDRATAYALRHATTLTVVRLDIDNFSALHSRHGKQKAESILTTMASSIKSILRQEDVAARLGVAKFALLLIETDRQDVDKVINRLRSVINETDFSMPEPLSISIGCACASPAVKEVKFDELINNAEQALEQALHSGHGNTVYADEAAQPAGQIDAAGGQQKKGQRINLSAVLQDIEKNEGKRLGEKQLYAALNSLLPLLSFLNKKLSLEIDEVIEKLTERVNH